MGSLRQQEGLAKVATGRNTLNPMTLAYGVAGLLVLTIGLTYVPTGSSLDALANVVKTWSDQLIDWLLLLGAVVAARRSPELRQRRFWAWVGAVVLMLLLGSFFETLAWIRGAPKIIDWNDGFFYAAYALLIAYQWRFLVQEKRVVGLAKVALDYVTTILAGTVVIWFLLQADISTRLGSFAPTEQFALASFMALDIFIAFTFFTMAFKSVDGSRTDYSVHMPVYLGFACVLMSDLIWHANTLRGAQGVSPAVSVLIQVFALAICLAVIRFLRNPEAKALSSRAEELLSAGSSFSVYGLTFVTLIVLGDGVLSTSERTHVALLGLIMLGVMTRQYVAAREHTKITTDLAIKKTEAQVNQWFRKAMGAEVGAGLLTGQLSREVLDVPWLSDQRRREWRSVFDSGDRDAQREALVSARSEIRANLLRALEQRWFVPAFQSIHSLASGKIKSFEVLARCRHPDAGLLAPDKFIGLIEDAGLSGALLESLFAQTFSDPEVARLRVESNRKLRFAFNLTSMDLGDPELSGRLEEAIQRLGVLHSEVSFEFTERQAVDWSTLQKWGVDRLRSSGVRFSIDDFGTGYSSLSYLTTSTFDVLKIDKTFISSITNHDSSLAVLVSMLQLADAMGLEVVAEGVETRMEAEQLQQLGCGMAQGYLYTRPILGDRLCALADAFGMEAAGRR